MTRKERTGGAIRTHAEDGFIAEAGPHGFLDNCEESKAILADIGLDTECVQAPLSRFVRYVYVSGALRQIPQTPLSILKTPLIGWKDKFRILADLWKKPLQGEPTVAKMGGISFRPGPSSLCRCRLTGTYAGDMDKLAIDGVMPGVRALEKKHGSVIRGLLAGSRRRNRPQTAVPAGHDQFPRRDAEIVRTG